MRSRGQLGQPAEPGRGHEASLAARRAEYAARLRESLDRIVASLAALDEVERVSVFGSYARGRVDLGTDLDVLVVMRTDRGFVDRLRALYSRLAVPVDLDLLLLHSRGIRRHGGRAVSPADPGRRGGPVREEPRVRKASGGWSRRRSISSGRRTSPIAGVTTSRASWRSRSERRR